jgi:hypothetical protein
MAEMRKSRSAMGEREKAAASHFDAFGYAALP